MFDHKLINKYYRAKYWLKYRLKIRKVLKNLKGNLPQDYKREAKKFCKETLKGKGSHLWHYAYAKANGIYEPHYIPEDFFYHYLEPAFNYKPLTPAYTNKLFLNKLVDGLAPTTFIGKVNGMYIDPDTQTCIADPQPYFDRILEESEIIFKPPVESGGGRNVKKLFPGENPDKIQKLLIDHPHYIVQPALNQHSELAVFNPDSINTVRLMTFFDGKQHSLLSAALRFGREGEYLDNQNSGGLVIGIDPKNGVAKEKAYLKTFESFREHPDSGIILKERPIPSFKKAIEQCLKIHLSLPYYRLISWDVVIDEAGSPIILEINASGQDINLHQLTNGPLLGNRTNNIIKSLMFFK